MGGAFHLSDPRGRPLPPELADGLAHRAVYDSAAAARLLGPSGIQAPHVADYVGPLLDYARRRLL